MEQGLHNDMLSAHARGDGRALVTLYTRAAEEAAAAGNSDAAAFFFTHAYIFALETGRDEATQLHNRLKALGRDE